MRVHGLCLIKNEGDFIGRSLRHAMEQFDFVYVLDNGSTDDTWAVVQTLAREFPERLVPWKSEDRDFRDSLRNTIFNAFRGRARPGDWWCRLDGDEIYADQPRDFLASVPRSHHVVWSAHCQYYFSEQDALRWEENPGQAGCPLPNFADLPRSYLSNASEARFFRHRDGLKWEGDAAWPTHMGLAHPRRIRLKHYQYRSPAQIQRRLDTRREAAARGYATFLHSLEEEWKSKIVDSAGFHQDQLDGQLIIDEALMPRHLEKPAARAIKRVMHGLGLWP